MYKDQLQRKKEKESREHAVFDEIKENTIQKVTKNHNVQP